ncbi:MAG: DUF6067 family protein [Candidatus Sumerlaeia bacterium]|nr:DUF6067 family protein [Candidatus Sumerlaeia bacterium]
MRRRVAGWFVVALLLVRLAQGNMSIPNPSFEDGTTAPLGWRLSGGVGQWENEGRTGGRCVSVTGDRKSSNFWSCPVPFEPGKIYKVEFWTKSSPDAAGGNVIAAGSLCNFDFPHAREWTRRSMVFRVPDRSDRPVLRLGHWQAKGKVWFDDVKVAEVRAVEANFLEPPGFRIPLAEGEQLSRTQYVFVAPLKQRMNWARPLMACSAGFNSNRWLLDDDAEIVFRHDGISAVSRDNPDDVTQSPLIHKRVEVDVGYHVSGRCAVEASSDGKDWTLLGTLEGVKTAEFPLPKSLDAAAHVWIRLSGRRNDGDNRPCSMQIHGYRFSATLAGLDLESRRKSIDSALAPFPQREHSPTRTGATFIVQESRHWPEQDAAGKAAPPGRLVHVGAPVLGGRNPVDFLINTSRYRFVAILSVDGKEQTYPSPKDVAYDAGRPGEHQAKVVLLDAATSKPLYEASWDYRIPSLYDSGFGYAVQSGENCDLWWAEAPYKISRQCPPPQAHQPIAISAAKGEYEPFQLILSPKRNLMRVSVKVLALQSDKGAKIPADAITVCRVGYVFVSSPTDEIGCAGDWPDPLPPCDKPFDLRASDGNQPLWITVRVPRDAAAGDYRGAIELSAEGGWKASVPFTLHVWDFEIPRENHLKTAFGFSTGNVRRYHNLKTEEEWRQVVDLYFKNFAEHRISPYDFAPFDPIEVRFPEDPSGTVKLDFTRFDRQAEKYLGPDYRFTTFRLPLSGMGGGTFHSRQTGRIGRFEQGSPEYERLFASYVKQLESHLREKGWLDKAYIYWFDEPNPKDYEFVRNGMERIHRAAPGLRRMLTEQPEKELDGAVDIWCPLTPHVTPELVAREAEKGREMWWYICTGPKGPYCTLFIDHPAIEFRMWSWQTWKTGVKGLLIWQSNYWTSDAAYPPPQFQNPWEDPMSYVSGYGTPRGTKKHWGNGDGRFLYPPNRDPMNDKSTYLTGPVNSIRWEMLREGIEDYEYFWLLRDLLEKSRTTVPPAKESSTTIPPVPAGRAAVMDRRRPAGAFASSTSTLGTSDSHAAALSNPRNSKPETDSSIQNPKSNIQNPQLARARELLSIPDSITRNQTHFTKDPLDLYRYREEVAKAIEALIQQGYTGD